MNVNYEVKESKKYVNPHTKKVYSLQNRFWIEGYLITYSPVFRKEDTKLKQDMIILEWSLENGEFFLHDLTLGDEDDIYQKIVTIFKVESFENRMLEDILVKRCGLLVTVELVTDEMLSEILSYELHDICSLDELNRNRINYSDSPKLEVNSNESY